MRMKVGYICADILVLFNFLCYGIVVYANYAKKIFFYIYIE